MNESVLLSLPYGSILTSLIIIVLGFASMYYWFDKDRRARRKEENEADERLVGILQKTVSELEKKVTAQGTDIKELTKKVGELEHDNERLIKILQGRDEKTQQFYENLSNSLVTSQETHELVLSLATSMDSLIKLLERHQIVVK